MRLVPSVAATAQKLVMPGIICVAYPRRRSSSSTSYAVAQIETSPRFTMATLKPASSTRAMLLAARTYSAFRADRARAAVNFSGTIDFRLRSTAPRATSSAGMSPEADLGAAMTGQKPRTSHAWRVIHAGSPGPTPTA